MTSPMRITAAHQYMGMSRWSTKPAYNTGRGRLSASRRGRRAAGLGGGDGGRKILRSDHRHAATISDRLGLSLLHTGRSGADGILVVGPAHRYRPPHVRRNGRDYPFQRRRSGRHPKRMRHLGLVVRAATLGTALTPTLTPIFRGWAGLWGLAGGAG